MNQKLPIDYVGFANAILALHLRRVLAQKFGLNERDVFVWPVGPGCFQAIGHQHLVDDGIPVTRVLEGITP